MEEVAMLDQLSGGRIEYAGRHGFNFVGLGPAAAVREHTEAYRQAWGAHKHDPARLNGHVAAPKIGILRLVVIAAASASHPLPAIRRRRRGARRARDVVSLDYPTVARARRPQHRRPVF